MSLLLSMTPLYNKSVFFFYYGGHLGLGITCVTLRFSGLEAVEVPEAVEEPGKFLGSPWMLAECPRRLHPLAGLPGQPLAATAVLLAGSLVPGSWGEERGLSRAQRES